MGHILGPRSHVSIANLDGLLLARSMEIWDRECGLLSPIFVVFTIFGQVGNTISPWGKGPGQHRLVVILVACDQGSIALELRIFSSGLPGVVQLTMCARSPYFTFLAVVSPIA